MSLPTQVLESHGKREQDGDHGCNGIDKEQMLVSELFSYQDVACANAVSLEPAERSKAGQKYTRVLPNQQFWKATNLNRFKTWQSGALSNDSDDIFLTK